ncbi:signal peptide peptidase-like 2B-like protein [Corchorus capsularis]|uniref:Signal peptide peptidase-like 2B-like protein n=1 Tax=Corchorus capsularis TaxID=210143 RepID=A0A1R3J1P9_COCAP|nr:signal peptide peptidase-like 2B-like protein [Corchorus capsularis]
MKSQIDSRERESSERSIEGSSWYFGDENDTSMSCPGLMPKDEDGASLAELLRGGDNLVRGIFNPSRPDIQNSSPMPHMSNASPT